MGLIGNRKGAVGRTRHVVRFVTTPLGLTGLCDQYPGQLVPRSPGLEDAAPLGLGKEV
jgi:hypothetical protein